jgi:peptidoglycan hydrolase CwlO-like protein
MTRTVRSFPVGPRFAALCVAIAAVCLAVQGAGASTSPSQHAVQSAHQAYLDAQQTVRAYQAQIAAIQVELDAAVQQVDQAESELARIQEQVAETKRQIAEAKVEYGKIRQRLNDRAAEAFMTGPTSGLEFILGATSLSDLSDRVEFVDVVAQTDAGLAQQVANLEASLQIQESDLEQLEADQRAKVQEVQAKRDAILQDLSAQAHLRDQAAQAVQDYLSKWQDAKSQYNRYLRQLAAQAPPPPPPTTVGTGDTQLPPGYHNPLKVCPVDPPRAFGDGFGAPRYAGGFHLHAGNDILSDYGTPIRAPFDGTAKPTYNTLGGNSEYVYGSEGYVYNAHLDHYSANSNGPVKAGDIIGYVGDTGDAKGTPHDHFEWHPNSILANWPVSAYGYAVIGTAVNPYPMLLDVCG